MATTPTPEEAIDRAKRVLDDRIETIRQAVEARQRVADVREETDRERAELRTQLVHLGTAEIHEVLSPLFQAINAQQVHLEGPPI